MKHEKIVKKEDGSRVKITVSMSTDSWRFSDINYHISVDTCEPRKRTFKPAVDDTSYLYRSLSMDDRREHCLKKNIEIAGKDNINAAIIECWEKAKPDLY